MLFNIDKISDKFDALTDFIPLYKFDSTGLEQSLYVNKNKISSFSHIKTNDKECLFLSIDISDKDKLFVPECFTVCKDDNPVAFNELFKGLPEKLPKYNNTTGKLDTTS